MQNIGAIAKQFFQNCEQGKGWEHCKQFCLEEATFSCQTPALATITKLSDYTQFMKGLFALLPDARYQLTHFSVDEERKTVAGVALFRGTHTGQPGPGGVAATGKSTESDYAYVMAFDGEKIKQMTKIWNHHSAFRQLGWE